MSEQPWKWAFENSAKLIALLSFALLVLATVHDWGYFLVIGPKFRSIQTTYDYITGAIEWLPPFLLIGVACAGFAFPLARFLEPKEEEGFEDQLKRHRRKRANLMRAFNILLSAGALVLSLFEPFPLNVTDIAAAVALALLSFAWTASKEATPKFVVYSVLMTCCVIFIFGVGEGVSAIDAVQNVHQINIKGGGLKQASVLRTFEKGILIWSPPDQSIEFIRWEQVDELSYHVRKNTESTGCRFFTWFCKNSVEP